MDLALYNGRPVNNAAHLNPDYTYEAELPPPHPTREAEVDSLGGLREGAGCRRLWVFRRGSLSKGSTEEEVEDTES